MGRKPYKKIKLTDEEFNVVEKIADLCKVGWFSIAGDTIDSTNGKVVNKPHSTEYDECYDQESKRYISLQYGLKLLGESFSDLDLIGLTEDEKTTWLNLICRIS